MEHPRQPQAVNDARASDPPATPPLPPPPDREADSDINAAGDADVRRRLAELGEDFAAQERLRPTGGAGQTLAIRVGRYHITREIAMGGMASVYEAIQDNPRRIVALKLLRTGWGSAAQQRRFEFESQLLARMRHPHIAQVFDAGTHEHGDTRVPYFVMEFIPGARSITTYAEQHKLTRAQRIELFALVCDAVHYANTKGIIHRDLKPGNILVDLQGSPKVIDFGVARAADSDQVSPTLQTAADQLIGTLQYMSPEQVEIDPRQLDARSDVYSLGVVLYEMLCGRLPYDVTKVNVSDATKIIRERPPQRPSVLTPNIGGDLETVLLTALQKDRERRYATAADLAQDLRHALAGDPIEARRDSAVYVLRRRAGRFATANRVGSILLAVLLSVVGGHYLGVALNRFTPVGAAYERFVTTWLSRAPKDALRHVRMISMRESTDMAALGGDVGVDGVRNGEVPTYRSLHARLLDRLAEAKPKVVVLDMQFRITHAKADPQLAGAMGKLKAGGCDVVIAGGRWNPKDGQPEISPVIAAAAHAAHTPIEASVQLPWNVQLIQRTRGREAQPSLALMAASAYWCPGARPFLLLDAGAEYAELQYRTAGRAPSIRVELTSAAEADADDADTGLRAGDFYGQYFIELPRERALASSTLDYERVHRATDSEFPQIAEQLRGKAVFIVNLRRDGGESFSTTPDGRLLPACTAQAVALDMLLAGDSIRRPRLIGFMGLFVHGRYLFELVAAAAGVTLALVLRRPSALIISAVGASALIIAAAVGGYWWMHTLYNPAYAVANLLLAIAATATVVRVSERTVV